MTDPLRESSGRAAESRLYLPDHNGWSAAIKQDWSKEYCFAQNPGDDHYHLLLSGEIYLQRGTEKYCLNCALRHGYITRDRRYWQRESGAPVESTDETEASGL